MPPDQGKTSEFALLSMVSNLPGIVYRCRNDVDRTMTFVSDGVEAITGCPAADFVDNAKRSFASLIYPDDVAQVEQSVEQAIADRQPYSAEYRVITAEGAILDITDRKESEQRLRAGEARYRSLFDTSRDGIVFCSLDGRIEDANAAYLDMLGYSLEEARELTYKQITPEKWAPLEADILERQVKKRGYSEPYEKEYIRRGGTVFPIQIRAWQLTDKASGTPRLMGQVRDLTDFKRAEATLERTRRDHELILQSAGLGIFKLDRDATITFINDAALQLLGWDADELVGRPFGVLSRRDGTHADAEGGDVAIFAETLHDGSVQHCGDGMFVRKDGSAFWISGTSAPMRENGHVTGAVVVFTDITERKQADDALRQSEMQLANAQRLAHLGSWELDVRTRQEIWSDEVYRILGLDPQNCSPSYEAFVARVHPDDLDRHERCVREALYDRKAYSHILRIVQPGGAERILQTHGEVERDERGDPLRMSGTIQDITDRHRVEAAMQREVAANKLLHRIAVAANDASETESALRICIEEVCAYAGWPVGHAYVLSPDGSGELVSSGIWHLDDPSNLEDFCGVSEEVRFKEGQGMVGRVAARGEPVWIEDVATDPDFVRTRGDTALGVVSAAAFPVLVGKDVVGVVEFFSPEAVVPDEYLLSLMARVGTLLGRVFERKQSEEALRQSEARLRALFDNAPLRLAFTDPEGRVLLHNQAYAEELGLPEGSLVGKTASDVLSEEVAAKIAELDGEVIRTGASTTQELHVTSQHGAYDFLYVKFPIIGSEGVLTGFGVVIIDITERTQAEEALRQSEARLAEAQRIAGVGNWGLNLVSDELYWSAEVYRILGLDESRVSLSAEAYVERIHPDDRQRVKKTIRESNKSGTSYSDEYRIVRPDGEVRTVVTIIEYDHDEHHRPTWRRGTIQDITERKQKEDALRERERAYSALVGNLPGMVYRRAYEAGKNAKYWSSGSLALTGYTPEELTQGNPAYGKLINPDDRARIEAERRIALDEGESFQFAHRITTKSGAEKWVWEHGSRVSEPGKRPELLEGFVTDITKQKLLEQEVREAQKMSALGQLAGGVAHDFNNLLMVIGGYAQRARAHASDAKQVETALSKVAEATEQATGLTKQLLAFGRRQSLEKKVVRVSSLLAEAEGLLGPLLGETVQHQVDVADESAAIETDPGQLLQAIVNLSINARHAMPKGGRLRIAAQVAEADEKFLGRHANLDAGRYVCIALEDNGSGMDDETAARIFEPFFTTKEQGKGTGLGLAMVYGFVQQSGGAIEVDTELGRGTTFRIYLPLVEKAPAATVMADEDVPIAKGETILLVEDEENVRELMLVTLEELGYKVLVASDGMEALELESEHEAHIDLLLSDVVMPGIGGFELCKIIRETRPATKMLLMSGYPSRGHFSEKSRPSGVALFVKPLAPTDMARAIRKTLDEASAAA